MSLAMRGLKLASLKFGSRTDAAVVGPIGEPKIRLTIACALRRLFWGVNSRQFIHTLGPCITLLK